MKVLQVLTVLLFLKTSIVHAQPSVESELQLTNKIQKINLVFSELRNSSNKEKTVSEKKILFTGAKGLRLHFSQARLPENSFIEINSPEMKSLILNQDRLESLNFTTPYMQGQEVHLKIILAANSHAEDIKINMAEIISVTETAGKSICGSRDDREPSSSPQFARMMKVADGSGGCTGTMISPTCLVSAGHCLSYLNIAQFNVPESNDDGSPNYPGPEDQYAVNKFYGSQDSGPGRDWAVVSLKPNAITGALPGTRQGYLPFSSEEPQRGQQLQITGYGIDRNQPRRRVTQQTHYGELVQVSKSSSLLRYQVDTEPGNSGSTVIDASSQSIIGIHSHGGCYSSGGSNQGTALAYHSAFKKAIQKCLADDSGN